MASLPDEALCQGETNLLTPQSAIRVKAILVVVSKFADIALISLHWRTSVPAAVTVT